MAEAGDGKSPPVARISMSLPAELLSALDRIVDAQGFASRSQAIGLMINRYVAEQERAAGEEVMVGTITLFYSNAVPGLQKQLADLQLRHIDEVINSLHVHLIHNQTLEVILVQGPEGKLRAIADEMTTLRGVIYGRTQLIASLIPPLHPFTR